jgi:MFS family permease
MRMKDQSMADKPRRQPRDIPQSAAARSAKLASLPLGFAGRAALGRGFGAGRAARGLLAAGLVVVLAGTGLVWAAPTPILAGIGLFVAGLGLAGMWPIGVAVALQDSSKASYEAAARATLASGVAVLVAPSLLGLLSDHVGVVSAWPIILLMAAAGLAVLAITPRADTPAVAVEA